MMHLSGYPVLPFPVSTYRPTFLSIYTSSWLSRICLSPFQIAFWECCTVVHNVFGVRKQTLKARSDRIRKACLCRSEIKTIHQCHCAQLFTIFGLVAWHVHVTKNAVPVPRRIERPGGMAVGDGLRPAVLLRHFCMFKAPRSLSHAASCRVTSLRWCGIALLVVSTQHSIAYRMQLAYDISK